MNKFALIHPRCWATWLGVSILYLFTRLPYAWQLGIGRYIGRILYKVLPKKRHITEVNIRLCFPELTQPQQQQLVKDIFIDTGMAIIETGISWFAPEKRIRRLTQVQGLEHIDAAKAKGRGVILLGAHYTTIDIAGRLLSFERNFCVTYREQNNPVVNYLLARRNRGKLETIHRYDIRGFLRALKQNKIVWYAADQDYGPKHSIFAPFFNISAATITAFLRIAQQTNAVIIPVSHHRLANNKGYKLIAHPAFETIPSGNIQQDLTTTNAFLEQQIRKHPAQYLWLHRRFKTRPNGEAGFY